MPGYFPGVLSAAALWYQSIERCRPFVLGPYDHGFEPWYRYGARYRTHHYCWDDRAVAGWVEDYRRRPEREERPRTHVRVSFFTDWLLTLCAAPFSCANLQLSPR